MSLAALSPWLYAVFLWWFATGIILWLDRLPRRTFGWSFAGMSVLTLAALTGVFASAGDASVAGAFIAFTSAIVLWGWHEMSFLMGFISGPRKTLCPPDARGWRRFKLAAATLIYHEIALALTALALGVALWWQANQVAALTFALLWIMRLSAKLNLFLGAAHTGEDLLPAHLMYLKSYFRRRRMNALFPVSIVVSASIAIALTTFAFDQGASAFVRTGAALVLALTLLALIEHLFLFLPPPTAWLWSWAMAKPLPAAAPRSGRTLP
jgi:putative photosynthetic complex assembly protein 2